MSVVTGLSSGSGGYVVSFPFHPNRFQYIAQVPFDPGPTAQEEGVGTGVTHRNVFRGERLLSLSVCRVNLSVFVRVNLIRKSRRLGKLFSLEHHSG